MILRQPQDLLGNRVQQHFVSTAGDPAGRCADPAFRPGILRRSLRVDGKTIGPHQVQSEFGQLLPRPDRNQLVERAFRTGLHPGFHQHHCPRRDRIQRISQGIGPCNQRAHAAIRDRRAAIDFRRARQAGKQCQRRAEAVAAGCDIAFDHQRRHGHGKATTHRRQALAVFHPHIVEEAFVDVGIAGSQLDLAHGDAGCAHVHPEIGQALVLGHSGIGARNDHAIVGEMGIGGPQLLAVQPPAVAVRLRLEAQAGKVRSGGRFGEQLAPDFLAAHGLAGLLDHEVAVLAKAHQHRDRHAQRYAEIVRGKAHLHLFGFEGDLFQRRQTLTAELPGPGNPGETGIVPCCQVAAAQRQVLFARQPLAGGSAVSRLDRLQPGAGAAAECFDVGHAGSASSSSTSRSSQNSMLPASFARLRARRMWRCRPASQVAPIPPWTCTQSRAAVS